MTQWMKWIVCQCRGMSSDPQHPCKSQLHTSRHLPAPSVWRQVDSCWLACQNSEYQVKWEVLSQKVSLRLIKGTPTLSSGFDMHGHVHPTWTYMDLSQTKKKRKENEETSSERSRSIPVFRSETRHVVHGEDGWKPNFLSLVSPFFLSLLINDGALRNSLSVTEKPSSTVSKWGQWLKGKMPREERTWQTGNQQVEVGGLVARFRQARATDAKACVEFLVSLIAAESR